VDGGFFVLLGNDEYLLRQVDVGEAGPGRDYAWMIGATGGCAIKLVNPGGVQAWKSGQRNITEIDQPLGSTR
jgi:formylmethanofuran dehydrogenase subunit A